MRRRLQSMNINRRRFGGSFSSSGEEFANIVANEKLDEPSATIKLSRYSMKLNFNFYDVTKNVIV